MDYLGTRKLLGEKAECAFVYQAMEHGLIVSKPYGDSAAYDFVVERREAHRRGRREEPARAGRAKTTATRETNPGGRRGKLWKIQVKSATRFTHGVYEITTRHRPGLYLPGEIDFFAGWVVPLDVWYIIPARVAIARSTACLSPHLPNSHRRYEKYKEAWELLKN